MKCLLKSLAVVVSLAAVLSTSAAWAQGVLINIQPTERVALPRYIVHTATVVHPAPPAGTYKIKDLAVQVKLVDQVARTQVSQSFVNTGSTPMEVCFVFPLPYDGAIEELTLLIDGKEFPAKLMAAADARKVYEEIVRKNRDPALLEWMGTGMFKTSVFPVPPGAERKVTLRYSQLCRKDQGLTDFVFPLSTAKYTSQPVEKIEFAVSIESGSEIKNVYSPSHAIEIKRPDNKHAQISFTATNQIPSEDFRLMYDVGKGELGASLVSYRPTGSDEGYFLLLASPQIKAPDAERPKKTVVFVVDRSGSMSGKKFEQAKGALKFVLNNLREGDLFNIVAYDSRVESFKPELQKFDEETRKAATAFVEGLYAGGSTNIDGALKTALGQLKDSSRPNFVIFLTDGLPTDGETNEGKIVADAQSSNGVRARIFPFGVGFDVNSRLLEKIARGNFGQTEYVRPSEDIEARVASLYGRIGSPVMTDLSINYEFDAKSEGSPVSRTYPAEVRDLFAGEQLAIVGRYKKSGMAKVTVTGRVGGQEQKFDFPANFVETSGDQSNAFVEKLWAMRRVGQIVDELDLKGKNEELIKELVAISTKHGILTPYTSFLAEEKSDRHDLAGNAVRAGRNLTLLDRVSGAGGVNQRRENERLRQAAAPASKPASLAEDFALKRLVTKDAKSAGRGGAAALGAKFYAGGGGLSTYASADSDEVIAVDSVQTIGNRAFYRDGARWVESQVTKEQQAKVIEVERYSDQYFELVRKHGKPLTACLVMDEPVVLELAGQVYEFK